MSVYVDDAYIPAKVKSGSLTHDSRWCHMTADTTEELIAMALRIGLQAKYIQYPGTWNTLYCEGYGDVLAFTGDAEELAAALSAAGFGLVADAKGAAWDEVYKAGELDGAFGINGHEPPRERNPYRTEASS